MKEYKTSEWPIKGGRVNTDNFDRYLNDMQRAGWELFSTSVLPTGHGDGNAVLSVFVRETNEIHP